VVRWHLRQSFLPWPAVISDRLWETRVV